MKNCKENLKFVDLGLPSGIKWASMNLGAENVQGFGGYYSIDEVLVEDGGCMPSDEDFAELRENCIWQWTKHEGVNGYDVRSKKNNNSIFLPAAGVCSGKEVYFAGEVGYYLTGSKSTNDSVGMNEFIFSQNYKGKYVAGSYKRSVRLVSK